MLEAREEMARIQRLAVDVEVLIGSEQYTSVETLGRVINTLDAIVVRAASMRDSIEDRIKELEREERN